MNPDMMPIPWWKDYYSKSKYDISRDLKEKHSTNKDFDALEKVCYRDWLQEAHDLGFDPWYDESVEDWKTSAEDPPARQWQTRRFQEGQLVEANFAHPAYAERRGQLALVIQSDLQLSGQPTKPQAVRIMWPDGELEDVSEDDLQMCKSNLERL